MKIGEVETHERDGSQRWEETEIKRKTRNVSIGIPTKDLDIRNIFRLFKEPTCLFGEDNYDRRSRLKKVLIGKYNQLLGTTGKEKTLGENEKNKDQEKDKQVEVETKGNRKQDAIEKGASSKELETFCFVLKRYYIDLSNFFEVDSSDYIKLKRLGVELKRKTVEERLAREKDFEKLDTIKEKFYTESTEELRLSRFDITLRTLPRIYGYKSRIHTFQEQYTKEQYENYIQEFNEHMKSNLELHISQFGDSRPLTRGKFSPDNISFAVSSYNTYVSIFSYQNGNYDLITSLTGGHVDKINDICWNYTSNYSYYSCVRSDEIEKEQLLLASCSSDKSFCVWKPFANEGEETEVCERQRNRTNTTNEFHANSNNGAKLLWQLKAHEERINQVQFHPLNNYLMTCSEDETIKFFDIEKRKELFYQEGHNSNVYCIAFNPFGNLYLSGDSGGGLMFWDIRTGRNIAKEIVHTNSIMNINFNPFFPNMFCTASADNTIKIFDLRSFSSTYNILAHNKIVTDAVFEPVYGRYIASSSFDTFIKIWDSVHFYCTKILYNNDSKVKNVDISPDGNFLASTSLDRTWKLYLNGANSEECLRLDLDATEDVKYPATAENI